MSSTSALEGSAFVQEVSLFTEKGRAEASSLRTGGAAPVDLPVKVVKVCKTWSYVVCMLSLPGAQEKS